MNVVCRHFGACGGCSLQHLAPDAYLHNKRGLIQHALARHGILDLPRFEIISVPSRSRRRATLKLQNSEGAIRLGFHMPRSHELIDIQECHVLTPGVFRAAQALRDVLGPMLQEGDSISAYIAEADNGCDVAIEGLCPPPEAAARIGSLAAKFGVVRLTADGNLMYARAAPEVTFGKARVALPSKAFLQPTREGEILLQTRVAEAVKKAKRIADLFCGCGTFALPLAERAAIHAVDANRPMLEALAPAARSTAGLKPVTTERRDLLKHPLRPAELGRFDAVVLDPPRAGASAQAQQLAKSSVRRIAYVSCDAASFARDARILIDGGFRMDGLLGVDQFLWSEHIELVAQFSH